jgi:tetratricopeptide (TPR) repeat protein
MTSKYNNRYKSIIAVVFAITFIFTFSFILSSCSRSESPEKGSRRDKLKQSGPLVDQGNISLTDELEANANDPEALSSIGDRYFEGGKYIEAIDIYKKVISLDPNDIDTYNDLGLAYQYMNQTDKAIETLKKGTEIMPSYQRIWISLGFVSISAGNKEEAKKALAKTIELGPDTPVGKEASRMLDQIK